jgi:ankyrin repeat protein/L-ascorbate metabolism protein UlaG (beta-lactamase superfamily)
MKERAGAFITAAVLALTAAAVLAAQDSPPIVAAAESGDLEAVARLLKTDPKLVEAKNAEGDTALHAAAGCRRGEQAALPIVALLLEKGAVLDARNPGNQTPLLYAAYAGFRQVAELLIAKGAAVQYQDALGRSPLHYAAREGRPEVVELLLGHGADPSLKDSRGLTPLAHAVSRNKTAVVETLMRLTKVDPRSPEGSMVLHAAAAQGNEALVASLLERGADPGRPSPNGDAFLLSCLRGGMSARAAALIEEGADVGARDAAGRTALHLAAERGLNDIAAALLEKGADANAADANGRTPLRAALDWGYAGLAGILTKKGARPADPKAYILKGGAHEVGDPPPGAETAVIRYIGTDGFLIEAGGKAVLVDGLVRNPWGYANTPERALALMKARQAPFEKIDLLLFSHAHRDHFEPTMALDVLAAQTKAALAGDGLVSADLQAAGTDAVKALGDRIKILDTRMGERTDLTLNGVRLSVLGVNHGEPERPYLTLGYVWDMGGFKIYHQGDIYPPANLPFLASLPWESEKVDIAFFDPFFLQNEEAKRLVLERIRPSAVVLMHMRDDEVGRYEAQLRPAVPQVVAFLGPMERKVFVKPRR